MGVGDDMRVPMSDPRQQERHRRLVKALATEMRRVVDDLVRRRDLLVQIWGHRRVRAPFLDTVFSRYRTLGMDDLLLLEETQLARVERFYSELDDLRFYLAYTQDMPRALTQTLDSSIARLARAATSALDSLGVPLSDEPRTAPPWGSDPDRRFGTEPAGFEE